MNTTTILVQGTRHVLTSHSQSEPLVNSTLRITGWTTACGLAGEHLGRGEDIRADMSEPGPECVRCHAADVAGETAQFGQRGEDDGTLVARCPRCSWRGEADDREKAERQSRGHWDDAREQGSRR